MFNHKRKIVVATQALLILGLLVAGCSKGQEVGDPSGAANAALMDRTKSEAPLHEAARQSGAERNVARRGTLDVEVPDLEAAEKKISQFTTESRGYVAQLEGNGLEGDQAVMHIVLRVPEKSFETVIALAESLGKRTSKSVSATDLTESILDVEAQIRKQHGEESAKNPYIAVDNLQQVKDALLAKASMSVIDLSIHQKPSADRNAAANSTWGSDTWNSAVSSAMTAFRAVGAVCIWLLVYVPFWGPVAIAGWMLLRPRRRPIAPV